MVCVYCDGETEVVNSRLKRKNNQVWRRRHCTACGATFSTEETVQYELAWLVSDGKHSQPFLRDKLFLSLYKSCEHRKTALSDAKGLTETIIRKLSTHLVDGTVSKRDIAQVAQVALNRFDKAASVHYQSFHKGVH
jgi:transcriptional repressor NrdR